MNMRAVTVYLSIRPLGGVGVYMLTSMFCDAFHQRSLIHGWGQCIFFWSSKPRDPIPFNMCVKLFALGYIPFEASSFF